MSATLRIVSVFIARATMASRIMLRSDGGNVDRQDAYTQRYDPEWHDCSDAEEESLTEQTDPYWPLKNGQRSRVVVCRWSDHTPPLCRQYATVGQEDQWDLLQDRIEANEYHGYSCAESLYPDSSNFCAREQDGSELSVDNMCYKHHEVVFQYTEGTYHLDNWEACDAAEDASFTESPEHWPLYNDIPTGVLVCRIFSPGTPTCEQYSVVQDGSNAGATWLAEKKASVNDVTGWSCTESTDPYDFCAGRDDGFEVDPSHDQTCYTHKYGTVVFQFTSGTYSDQSNGDTVTPPDAYSAPADSWNSCFRYEDQSFRQSETQWPLYNGQATRVLVCIDSGENEEPPTCKQYSIVGDESGADWLAGKMASGSDHGGSCAESAYPDSSDFCAQRQDGFEVDASNNEKCYKHDAVVFQFTMGTYSDQSNVDDVNPQDAPSTPAEPQDAPSAPADQPNVADVNPQDAPSTPADPQDAPSSPAEQPNVPDVNPQDAPSTPANPQDAPSTSADQSNVDDVDPQDAHTAPVDDWEEGSLDESSRFSLSAMHWPLYNGDRTRVLVCRVRSPGIPMCKQYNVVDDASGSGAAWLVETKEAVTAVTGWSCTESLDPHHGFSGNAFEKWISGVACAGRNDGFEVDPYYNQKCYKHGAVVFQFTMGTYSQQSNAGTPLDNWGTCSLDEAQKFSQSATQWPLYNGVSNRVLVCRARSPGTPLCKQYSVAEDESGAAAAWLVRKKEAGNAITGWSCTESTDQDDFCATRNDGLEVDPSYNRRCYTHGDVVFQFTMGTRCC